jgi:hypothetical protein
VNEVNEKKVGVNNMVSWKRNKKLATKGTQDEDFDFDFDLIFDVLTPLSTIFQLYHGDQF